MLRLKQISQLVYTIDEPTNERPGGSDEAAKERVQLWRTTRYVHEFGFRLVDNLDHGLHPVPVHHLSSAWASLKVAV